MAFLTLLLLASQSVFIPALGVHDTGVFNHLASKVRLEPPKSYAAKRVGLLLDLKKGVLHVTVDRVPVSIVGFRLRGDKKRARLFRKRGRGAIFAVSRVQVDRGQITLRLLNLKQGRTAWQQKRIYRSDRRQHRRARWRFSYVRRRFDKQLTRSSWMALIGPGRVCPARICLELGKRSFAQLASSLGEGSLTVLRRLRWYNDRDRDGIHDQVDLLIGAKKLVANKAIYKEGFHYLRWPMGDVPGNTGVCTDVLIRSLRNAGLDLQVLLQRHITKNRGSYPWVVSRSASIDHRRVKNLLVYFSDTADLISTAITNANKTNYLPGDIIFMDTITEHRGPDHVAIVSDRRGANGYPLLINNRGRSSIKHTGEMAMLPRIPVTHHFRLR